MREVIATGKTVEEATENGCAELGLGRDEVSVEILEMPAKKLFKSTPARVKVTADGAGAEPAAAPAEAPRQEEAKPQPKPQQPKDEPRPAAAQAAPQQGDPLLPAEPEEEIDLAVHTQAKKAADYLSSIFAAMGAGSVDITAFKQGDATLLRVEGEQIADVVEIRGELIQALSYLIDRAVNAGVDKKDEGYLRIRLDVAGYRNRREGELIALANRTGKEVARTGRSRTLAPMNPYERLIVHTAISKLEGVTSESTGADVERRVVVCSTGPNATEGEDWRPPRKQSHNHNSRDRGPRPGGPRRDDRGGRGGQGGGRGRRDDRGDRGGDRGGYRGQQSNTPGRDFAEKPRDPNAQPVVPGRREAIRDGDDLPLYGKIEL